MEENFFVFISIFRFQATSTKKRQARFSRLSFKV
jgi:hypothetical protein